MLNLFKFLRFCYHVRLNKLVSKYNLYGLLNGLLKSVPFDNMLNEVFSKLDDLLRVASCTFVNMLNKLVSKHVYFVYYDKIAFGTMLNKTVSKPQFNMILCNYYCLS